MNSANSDSRAAIALGSNLGDSLFHLRQAAKALRQLSAFPNSVRASSIYRSAPVDCLPNTPSFLNAVIEIDWKGKVEALWEEMQRLEFAAGRRRPHPPHAARPLDLDLLYFGSHIISSGPILLPHPRLSIRRFVLAPLSDCAPDRILPNETMTVRQRFATLPILPAVEILAAPLFI